jgi:hypothetical protein
MRLLPLAALRRDREQLSCHELEKVVPKFGVVCLYKKFRSSFVLPDLYGLA